MTQQEFEELFGWICDRGRRQYNDMTQQEFEKIAHTKVSCDVYHDVIEPMYMATPLSKEEFVKSLNLNRFDVYLETKNMGRDRLLHKLAQCLDTLLREEAWNIFQWVPVEEELPPFNDLVLITYRESWKDKVSKGKKERINIATAKWMAGQWSVEVGIEGRFVLDGIKERNADGVVTEILAWLPLPKPYDPQPVREGRKE
ncbi:MAG: hypothetical protein Q4D90_02635 [bacterium]|nr:hypothetical protein [bacterium]